jgi:tetratricopeptide (TPR) repeat protein
VGEVQAACLQVIASQPSLPAAHNTAGLAEEAQGSFQAAASAYTHAAALLIHQRGQLQAGHSAGTPWLQSCSTSTVTGCDRGDRGDAGRGKQPAGWAALASGTAAATAWHAAELAVQLNRARALARAGQAAEAMATFEAVHAQESGAALIGSSPPALLAWAQAQQQVW